MNQIAWKFGGIAGLVAIVSMSACYAIFGESSVMSQSLGTLILLPGYVIVVFGIKVFCDRVKPEPTRFTAGIIVGFAIVGVMSVVYAIGWEIYLLLTDYRWVDVYIAHEIAVAESSGLGVVDLSIFKDEMAEAREVYLDPFFRFGITIMEVFPLGLFISLISVLLLRDPNLFKKSK